MKKHTTKKRIVLRMILIVILSVCIGVTVYRINVSNLTGDTMPMPLGFGMGVVVSPSMEPELSVDDMIFVVKADHYAVGDWVVFQSKGMLVVHELISLEGDTAVTKGTANDSADDPINVDQIKGRVAFHVGGVGVLINAIKSPIGTVLVLAIAVFLLVLSYKSEKKSDQDELDSIRREIERLKQEVQAPEASEIQQENQSNEKDGIA